MAMGTYYNVSCDVCSDTEALFFHTLKLRIEEAKRNDWKLRKGQWVCPNCLEKEQEEKVNEK